MLNNTEIGKTITRAAKGNFKSKFVIAHKDEKGVYVLDVKFDSKTATLKPVTYDKIKLIPVSQYPLYRVVSASSITAGTMGSSHGDTCTQDQFVELQNIALDFIDRGDVV